MARTTFLYEVLFRGNADGTISGSHMTYMERFTDDKTGELIVERELPAQPIDPAMVESLLGSEMTAAAAQVAKAQTDTTAMSAQLEQVTAERDALAGKIASARTALGD